MTTQKLRKEGDCIQVFNSKSQQEVVIITSVRLKGYSVMSLDGSREWFVPYSCVIKSGK